MPIVTTIFQALTTTIDERDQVSQTERKLLQRGYFTFISTLVNNNVTEVLSTQSMYKYIMSVGYMRRSKYVSKTSIYIVRHCQEKWF